MNNLQLLATITREPELKYTQGGIAILSFGVAYNEKRKQQDGSYQDLAHFFEVTAFGKKAETVHQWFFKGSRILIQGSLDYQSWVDKEGQKRNKVSIKLNDFDFIDRKADDQQPQQQDYRGHSGSNQANPAYEQPEQKHMDYREKPQQVQQQDGQQYLPEYPPEIEIDEERIPF